MKLLSLLFDYRGDASMYVIPIVISGLVLTAAMPAASRLSELIAQPWDPFPLPFFLVYAIVSAVMAVRIGAGAAPDDIDPNYSTAVLRILARVTFGHFLMLPLITYSRILFPDGVLPIVGATAHILLVCLMLALIAMPMQIKAERRYQGSLVRRHVFLFLYFALPLLALLSEAPIIRAAALVSPINSLTVLLSGSGSMIEWVLALTIPVVVGVVSSTILRSNLRRSIHA